MRGLLLVTVVAAAAIVLSEAASNRLCKQRRKEDWPLHWANPTTNCSTYFSCNATNQLKEETCPSKRVYNVETGKCVRRKRDICKLGKAAPAAKAADLCDGEDTGSVFPDPVECRTYYTCIDNVGYTTFCDAGSAFTDGHCVVDSEQSCWQNLCINQPNNAVLPSDTSCLVYYTCAGGVATMHTCPPDQYFDAATGVCQPDVEGANCPDNLCRDQVDGTKLPIVADCHSYYECQAALAVRHTCPQDSYFDFIDSRCALGSCTNDGDITVGTTECSTTEGDYDSTDATDGTDCASDATTETTLCTAEISTETTLCTDEISTEATLCTDDYVYDDTTAPPVGTPGPGGNSPTLQCIDGAVKANPSNCALLYVCFNDAWRSTSCGAGSYFNDEKHDCVVDTYGDCPECQLMPTRRKS